MNEGFHILAHQNKNLSTLLKFFRTIAYNRVNYKYQLKTLLIKLAYIPSINSRRKDSSPYMPIKKGLIFCIKPINSICLET